MVGFLSIDRREDGWVSAVEIALFLVSELFVIALRDNTFDLLCFAF